MIMFRIGLAAPDGDVWRERERKGRVSLPVRGISGHKLLRVQLANACINVLQIIWLYCNGIRNTSRHSLRLQIYVQRVG